MNKIPFPTPTHERAADAIVTFFRAQRGVDAVLLVNSLARGRGTPESDLDVAVLVAPALDAAAQTDLDRKWRGYAATEPALEALPQLGRFSGVHLDLFDGQFVPEQWDDGGGPDGFELELGNRIAYSLPLWEGGDAFAQLRAAWLPYYGAPLRDQRLGMVTDACRYDLDYVPFFVGRGLYFQAFDRLYKAFGEFLQALFIARRTYPIAYNKWIREQIVDLLGLPALYPRLPPILEISQLESRQVEQKAAMLRDLLDTWAQPQMAPGDGALSEDA